MNNVSEIGANKTELVRQKTLHKPSYESGNGLSIMVYGSHGIGGKCNGLERQRQLIVFQCLDSE